MTSDPGDVSLSRKLPNGRDWEAGQMREYRRVTKGNRFSGRKTRISYTQSQSGPRHESRTKSLAFSRSLVAVLIAAVLPR
jgi:hypothetical protein